MSERPWSASKMSDRPSSATSRPRPAMDASSPSPRAQEPSLVARPPSAGRTPPAQPQPPESAPAAMPPSVPPAQLPVRTDGTVFGLQVPANWGESGGFCASCAARLSIACEACPYCGCADPPVEVPSWHKAGEAETVLDTVSGRSVGPVSGGRSLEYSSPHISDGDDARAERTTKDASVLSTIEEPSVAASVAGDGVQSDADKLNAALSQPSQGTSAQSAKMATNLIDKTIQGLEADVSLSGYTQSAGGAVISVAESAASPPAPASPSAAVPQSPRALSPRASAQLDMAYLRSQVCCVSKCGRCDICLSRQSRSRSPSPRGDRSPRAIYDNIRERSRMQEIAAISGQDSLACPGKCGYQASDHANRYCCGRCSQGNGHGPQCMRKLMPGQASDAEPPPLTRQLSEKKHLSVP